MTNDERTCWIQKWPGKNGAGPAGKTEEARLPIASEGGNSSTLRRFAAESAPLCLFASPSSSPNFFVFRGRREERRIALSASAAAAAEAEAPPPTDDDDVFAVAAAAVAVEVVTDVATLVVAAAATADPDADPDVDADADADAAVAAGLSFSKRPGRRTDCAARCGGTKRSK